MGAPMIAPTGGTVSVREGGLTEGKASPAATSAATIEHGTTAPELGRPAKPGTIRPDPQTHLIAS
jgi:hypothetical protein